MGIFFGGQRTGHIFWLVSRKDMPYLKHSWLLQYVTTLILRFYSDDAFKGNSVKKSECNSNISFYFHHLSATFIQFKNIWVPELWQHDRHFLLAHHYQIKTDPAMYPFVTAGYIAFSALLLNSLYSYYMGNRPSFLKNCLKTSNRNEIYFQIHL